MDAGLEKSRVSEEDQGRALGAIWRDKMHVEPTALELSPPAIRGSFEHIWQPAVCWIEALRVFPWGLLDLWRRLPRGHLVFTHRQTSYRPGAQPWRDGELESVCYLSLTDLVADRRRAMMAQVGLFDHLLGSGAVVGGGWFSEGQGLNQVLTEVAGRYVAVHRLGYGGEELGAEGPREYFARGLIAFLQEPRRLNVIDPQLHKLFQTTIMSAAFWRRLS